MKPEDVPDEWVEAGEWGWDNIADADVRQEDYVRAIIAAAAPQIAAAEREACAKVADDYEPKRVVGDGGGREDECVYSAASNIAAAIRARGESEG